jgi:hypothetical protein
LLTELLQQFDSALQSSQRHGIGHIASEFQLSHGLLTVGRAGVAGNEYQIAILHAGPRPAQIVLKACGLTVFVNAEKRDVKIVARVSEVIGVAAKECGVKLRREHQAHIGVFLVFV